MREPEYCKNFENHSECLLCPNNCKISEGQDGVCLSRGRRNGKMVLHTYAEVVSGGLDPIEKKPLYHVEPGKQIFSVGTYGCNFKCRFCQNSGISQSKQATQQMLPQKLVNYAASIPQNIGVAFTYNEPGIWFEYIKDCAGLLKENNLFTVMVTNGFLSASPWKELCRTVDAMNIDLKAFSEGFYRDICGGNLQTVLNNIQTAHSEGVLIEITNLVVTGLNDNPADFERLVDFVANISPDIPLHISRYFPRYLERAQATPLTTMNDFFNIAKKRLNYVYQGNIAGDSDTHCPECEEKWVSRNIYMIKTRFSDKICACGKKLPFKFLGKQPKTE